MLFLQVSFVLIALILAITIAEVIANQVTIKELKKLNYEE